MAGTVPRTSCGASSGCRRGPAWRKPRCRCVQVEPRLHLPPGLPSSPLAGLCLAWNGAVRGVGESVERRRRGAQRGRRVLSGGEVGRCPPGKGQEGGSERGRPALALVGRSSLSVLRCTAPLGFGFHCCRPVHACDDAGLGPASPNGPGPSPIPCAFYLSENLPASAAVCAAVSFVLCSPCALAFCPSPTLLPQGLKLLDSQGLAGPRCSQSTIYISLQFRSSVTECSELPPLPLLPQGLKLLDSRGLAGLMKDLGKAGLAHRAFQLFDFIR